MQRAQISIAAAGVAVALSGAAYAQATQSKQDSASAPQVTLLGCVELEGDYRKRMSAGRGGALGTGVGAADEFVLTNVRPPAPAVGTSGSTREPDAAAAESAQTRVQTGGGVYTLTGPHEQELKRSIGRQIEVIGTIENAGEADTGANLADISDLPRVNIDTWHPVADFCPR